MNTIQHLTNGYERLLKLYPADFQAEFGEEMAGVFDSALQDVSHGGLFALTAVCLRELVDFPKNLLREYASKMGKEFGPKITQPLLLNPKQSASLGALGFGMGFALLILLRALADPANNTILVNFGSTWIRETLLFMLIGALGGGLIGAGSRSFPLMKRFIIAGTLGSGLGGSLGTLFLYLYYRFGINGVFHQAPLLNVFAVLSVIILIGALTGAALGLAQGIQQQAARLARAGAVGFGIANLFSDVTFASMRIFWTNTGYSELWFIPLTLNTMFIGIIGGAILGWAVGRTTDKTPTELVEQGDPK
jgi:hypothetical protein